MNSIIHREKHQLLAHLDKFADSIWVGKGKDTVPTADGSQVTAYTATMTMGPAFETMQGALGKANKGQKQWCVHYYSQRADASSGLSMHQETGYWLFDIANSAFCKAISTPHGIGILAGGAFTLSTEGGLIMVATAKAGSPEYGITNQPHLHRYSPMQSFTSNMTQTDNIYSYSETSQLRIENRDCLRRDEATLYLRR